MEWIKYVGAHDVVDVPRWQIGGAVRGEPVEVSDEAAADLLTQPANWQPAKATTNARNVLRGADDPVTSDPLLTESGTGADDPTATTDIKEG